MADNKTKKDNNKKPAPENVKKAERKLLDFIGQFESNGGDYNILYSGYKGKPEKPLTEMTINEVLELQEDMKSSGSSAVGAHQFINDTLKDVKRQMGLKGSEKFSPELQDKMILHRLKRTRGFDDFLEGSLSAEEFGKELSKEFASIPNPETGRSYYDGDGLNKSLTDISSVLSELDTVKKTYTGEISGDQSVDPSLIIDNPNLDEGTKEELLKINESQGLEQSTADQLLAMENPSLLSGATGQLDLNSFLVNEDTASKNQKQARRKPPVNELEQQGPSNEGQSALGYRGNIGAFDKNFNLLDHQFNKGGKLNAKKEANQVTEYNQGGSHEQNPLGGIPVGQNQQGGMNLVEEGETRHEDYIYSNEYKMDKKTAMRFNISPKYIGKSYSDISRDINDQIKTRPYDRLTKKTAEGNLNKLMMAQETARQEEAGVQQQSPDSGYNEGGQMNPASFLDGVGGLGGVMAGAGVAANMGQQVFGKSDIDTSGNSGRQDAGNGALKVGGDALSGVAAGAQVGGVPGAIVGGVLSAGASLFSHGKDQKAAQEANKNVTHKENLQYRNTFDLGGYLNKKGPGDGDEKKKKLKEDEVQDINESAGMNFEEGTANRLFGRMPGGASDGHDPKVNFGRYEDVNYFQMGNMDGDVIRINNTPNNPHNQSTIKPVMDELQALNPDKKLALEYKSYAKGGPIDPPGLKGVFNAEAWRNLGRSMIDGMRTENRTPSTGHNLIPNNEGVPAPRTRIAKGLTGARGNVKPVLGPQPRPSSAGQDQLSELEAIMMKGYEQDANAQNNAFDKAQNDEFLNSLPNNQRGILPESVWNEPGITEGGQGIDPGLLPNISNIERTASVPVQEEVVPEETRARQSSVDGAGLDYINSIIPGNTNISASQDARTRAENVIDPRLLPSVSNTGSTGPQNAPGNTEEAETGSSQRGMQAEELLRYAPSVGNLMRYLNTPDAQKTNYSRLSNRYQPNYVDEAALQNGVAQSAANTRRALANAAGGSQAAARANLLGSQVNETRALSDAMIQAQQMNAQQDQVAQQFNLNVDSTNQRIDMEETNANEQNQAARTTHRNQLLQSLLNDAGNIGREASTKRMLTNVTGYGADGIKDGAERENLFSNLNLFGNVLGVGGNTINRDGGHLQQEQQHKKGIFASLMEEEEDPTLKAARKLFKI